MSNYYKYAPRVVPAWAEALGVRSPEEMRFIIEEDGKFVFRPPRPEVLQKIMDEVGRKEAEAEQPAAKEVEQDAPPVKDTKPKSKGDFPNLSEIPAGKPVPLPRSRTMPLNRRSHSKQKKSTSKKGTVRKSKSRSLLVDLDSPPSWQSMMHTWHLPGGQFYWDASSVHLFRSHFQIGTGCFGTLVKAELTSRRPFNANLLHWLVNNQHVIPVDWRRNGRRIFFWNTIFEDANGNSCVMYMTHRRHRFTTGYQFVSAMFNYNDFACCLL